LNNNNNNKNNNEEKKKKKNSEDDGGGGDEHSGYISSPNTSNSITPIATPIHLRRRVSSFYDQQPESSSSPSTKNQQKDHNEPNLPTKNKKHRVSDALLTEYRNALMQERSQRLMLQDLCYRQLKRLEKMKGEAKSKHEALLEVAMRNMSLEEELDKLRKDATTTPRSPHGTNNSGMMMTNENSGETSSGVSQVKKPQIFMKMLGLNKSSSKSNPTVQSHQHQRQNMTNTGGGASMNESGHSYGIATDEQTSPDTSSFNSPMPASYSGAQSTNNSTLDDEEVARGELTVGSGVGGGFSMLMSSFKEKSGIDKVPKKSGKNQQQLTQQQEKSIAKLERQLAELQNKDEETEQRLKANEEVISYLKSQHRVTRDLLEGTKGKLSKSLRQCKLLNKERSRLNEEVEQLKSQLSDNMNKLEKWQELLQITEAEAKQLREQTVPTMQQQITELKDDVNTKNLTISQLSDKLVRLKDQLNTVRLQLRKFAVSRCHKFKPKTDATIVLHKNPMNNVFMIDILEGSKNQKLLYSYPMNMISDVQLTDKRNRFCITFSNNITEWFESVNCNDVVDNLREFMIIVGAEQ